MLKKSIFLMYGFISIASIYSQQPVNPDVSKRYSICELIDIALQNNPQTSVAWWNARRAAAAFEQTSSAFYPDIRFHGGINHGRDYKFINGQVTNYTLGRAGIILNYLLYDFGERRANSDAAKAALCAANWLTDWTLQRILIQVVNNAYSYLSAQELLNARLQSLQDTMRTLHAVEELYQVGLRSVNDLYALKATVADMKINISLQKAELDIAAGRLAASLGWSVNETLILEPLVEPDIDQTQQQDLNGLISEALQQRSDLMAKRAEYEQKAAIARKVEKTYLPKLTFNSDAGYKRYFHDKTNGFEYNIGLNIDFPIFKGFQSLYDHRVAYSDLQATESDLARLELEISLDVLTYSRLFEASQETLNLSLESLNNSIKTFEGIFEKYKIGAYSIFDLVAAQKQLTEARLKHSESKTRWYRSLAQLAYATGTPFCEESCANF